MCTVFLYYLVFSIIYPTLPPHLPTHYSKTAVAVVEKYPLEAIGMVLFLEHAEITAFILHSFTFYTPCSAVVLATLNLSIVTRTLESLHACTVLDELRRFQLYV